MTSAVSQKSTFHESYFSIVEKSEPEVNESRIEQEYYALKKDRDFCWMVSSCATTNKRFDVAAEIINNLPGKIHLWGKAAKQCMKKVNKSKIIDYGYTTRKTNQSELALSSCKFYFAFENSNCSDYVTEKFSNPLANFAIPIVNGWRENYEQILPGSFIHVADFASGAELAKYLTRLLVDKEKLLSYQKWRLKFELVREERTEMFDLLHCRVCEKVSEIREANKYKMTQVYTIPDASEAYKSIQKCLPR